MLKKIFFVLLAFVGCHVFGQVKKGLKKEGVVFSDTAKVVFEDGRLEYEICKTFGLKKGEVKFVEVKKIEELILNRKGIESIKGLEYFVGLKNLNLSQNKIKSLEPIRYLYNLEVLGLVDTDFPDNHNLTYLSQLKNLKKLYLGKNIVGDSVRIFSKLDMLEELYAERAQIKQIDVLKKLTKLKKLILPYNDISNIDVVQHFKDLEVLTLKNNPLDTINGIRFLKKLETIDLSSTNVFDVGAVVGNVNLGSLEISETKVRDVLPLGVLTNLRSLFLLGLNIPDNQIKHLKAKMPDLYIFK